MGFMAYFDGSCFLNYCGIGYAIRDADGFSVCSVSDFAGRGDALQAEYLALVALLECLESLRIKEAVIHGDSKTVVCQVNGLISTKNKNRFKELILKARQFLKERPGLYLKWIPRAENGVADALATEALSTVRCRKSQCVSR